MRRLPLPPDGRLPPAPAGGRAVVKHGHVGSQYVQRMSPVLRIVLSGEERYEIDQRPYRLGVGCMMLMPAGAPVLVSGNTDSVGVTLELAASTAPEEAFTGALLLPLVSHPVGAWLEEEASKLQQDDADALACAVDALSQLPSRIASLVLDSRIKMAALEAAKEITRLNLLSQTERARAHLQVNLHRQVPLWELAEVARMSQFHMSRAFLDVFQISPSTYHRHVRMEEAAKRLALGKSPTAVAAEMGFANSASFSRAFKRHHGHGPSVQPLPQREQAIP